MRSFVFFALILLLPLADYAQIVFERSWGGSGQDFANAVVEASEDGGYYVTGGKIIGAGVWGYKLVLSRLDQNGSVVWTKTYGSDSLRLVGNDLLIAANGELVVCGVKLSTTGIAESILMMRLDTAGNEIWQRTHSITPFADIPASFAQTPDSGFVITGYAGEPFLEDVFLLKTDKQGNLTWATTYGGGGRDFGRDVHCTRDGGYVVGGTTESFGAGTTDFYLIKLDVNGNVEWSSTFGTGQREDCYSICPTYDGGYIMGGTLIDTSSIFSTDMDIFMAKVDDAGKEVWSKNFLNDGTSGGFKAAYAMIQSPDGGYTTVGNVVIPGSFVQHAMRVDYYGNFVQEYVFEAPFGFGQDIVQSSDGGFVSCGNSWDLSSPDSIEMYLAKFVADSISLPIVFEDINVYPNPASSFVVFEMPFEREVSVVLYNASGQYLLQTPFNFTQKVELELSRLVPGVYLYTVMDLYRKIGHGRLVVH